MFLIQIPTELVILYIWYDSTIRIVDMVLSEIESLIFLRLWSQILLLAPLTVVQKWGRGDIAICTYIILWSRVKLVAGCLITSNKHFVWGGKH